MVEQLEFDFGDEKKEYCINKKIRLIELFAGYGSQSLAMQRIGADFESYKAVEFDSHACNLYNKIHDTNFPVLDITKIHAEDLEIIEDSKYEYILFYSFPCTDLSVAGKQKGMKRDSGTRSGLLWEVERLLKENIELTRNDKMYCMPSVLILENVPQVHSKKNILDFQEWINFLKNLGYSSYWQDVNAKNMGIPQNRNRTFMVSILGDYNFTFPNSIPLHFCCADILEDEVDEKYFIKNEKADKLIEQLIVEKKIPELENGNN